MVSPRGAILVSIDGLAGFYWDDPRAPLPTLRRLAERGVVAPRMRAVCPSTTWPTHVSLVTGVRPAAHGVAANSILNRLTGHREDLTGDPVYDAPALLRAPTVYDRAHAAGLRTAAIDWPATRRAASLDWNLPFFKNQAVFESITAPAVWRDIAAWGFPVERQGAWAQLPSRFLKDSMVVDLAARVLARYEPDLLLVHVLCVDSFQHLYGPRSPEAYWALAYVDAQLRTLLSALPGGDLDRALFVVSDHGFLPTAIDVRPTAWLRRAGVGQDVRFVMNHGGGFLYIVGGGDRDRLARDLAAGLASLEGVGGVWLPDDYAALGMPRPEDNPHAADIFLEALPGYSFTDDDGDALTAPSKYRGTHGQRPDHDDNHAFFLAVGPGIARGLVLPRIESRDVAPTIAHVLGLAMPLVEGRVLFEILAA